MLRIGIFLIILNSAFSLGSPALSHALERDLASDEISQLLKNIKNNPKNVTGRRFLFEYYTKKKLWKDAAQIAQPIVRDLTMDELSKLIKAQIAAQDGEAALQALMYYHESHEATAESKFLEGQAQSLLIEKQPTLDFKKQKVTAAVEAFKASTNIQPKQVAPYLAWVAVIEKHLTVYAEEAFQVYSALLKNNDNNKIYWAETCRFATEAKFWGEALKICEQTLSEVEDPKDSAVYLSQTFMATGQKEKAKEVLLEAEKKNPKSFQIQKNLAEFYMSENNPEAAIPHFYSATQIDPSAADVFLGQANALYKTKKFEEALIAFSKNCSLSRMVASEFKNASGQLRDNNKLQKKYKAAIGHCRK